MHRRRTPWGAAGVAVVILAAALGIGWLLGLVIALLPATGPNSGEQIQLLNGVGQVLSGALAAYLGSTIRQNAHDSIRDDDERRAAREDRSHTTGSPKTAPPGADDERKTTP